jgi:hypothetical protein
LKKINRVLLAGKPNYSLFVYSSGFLMFYTTESPLFTIESYYLSK